MSKAGRMAASNVLLLKRKKEAQDAKDEEKAENHKQEVGLQEAFRRADISGDGKLTVDEYYTVLQKHRIKATREEISTLMESAQEKNQDGFLSRSEIVGQDTVKGQRNAEMTQKAAKAFEIIDRNHDGFITKNELHQTTKKLTEKQIAAVFERNDKDGDGKLSKEEFTDMMCKEKRLSTTNT